MKVPPELEEVAPHRVCELLRDLPKRATGAVSLALGAAKPKRGRESG